MYSRVGRVPALDSASAPLARCGHSLTACLGENSRKLILFGGATALENSSSGGGAATGIRLAGATSDVHCFDIRSGAWTKLAPEGEAPSPRAAHAAAAVGSMVVVQARDFASCPAGCNTTVVSGRRLTAPCLNAGRHRARWPRHRRPVRARSGQHAALAPRGARKRAVCARATHLSACARPLTHRRTQVVQGEGPGARYAHVLALVGQRFLLVLGGNDGYKVRTRSRAARACAAEPFAATLTVPPCALCFPPTAACGRVGTRHGGQAVQVAERARQRGGPVRPDVRRCCGARGWFAAAVWRTRRQQHASGA